MELSPVYKDSDGQARGLFDKKVEEKMLDH